MAFRKERDTMGQVRVPSTAYYGAFTQRAIQTFQVSGERSPPSMVSALATIKEAAAQTNAALGIMDKRRAAAIVRAAREVREGRFANEFPVDPYQAGAGTPLHMNVNEVLANRASQILGKRLGSYHVHPNDHVNAGQSTNNVVPSALRIAVLFSVKELLSEMRKLHTAFIHKAAEFHGIIKVGRTHMQDAVPILLSQEFNAYGAYVKHGVSKLEETLPTLRELNMGGTAVGTGINTHPAFGRMCVQHISKITKEDFRETYQHVYLTQSTDVFVDVAYAMRNFSADMLKVCNDLVLMSSGPRAGVSELTLPTVEPGSSIMPGKINPSVVEAFKMVCLRIEGAAETVEHASHEGQLELNTMTPLIAHELLKSLSLLRHGVRMFRTKCVEGIRANKEACEQLFLHSLAAATALSPYLGYDATAKLVREALAMDKSIKDVLLEHGLMSPKDADVVLGADRLVSPHPIDLKLKERVTNSAAFRKFA